MVYRSNETSSEWANSMRRVLVCGGRNYADREQLFRVLDTGHVADTISCIIHGAARGADTLAGAWALERGVLVETYPANWDVHGRSAGHVRNKQMLESGKPNVVVAFPGGAGTTNMVVQAKIAGMPVVIIQPI